MHTARLWGGNWHKGESFRGKYKEVKSAFFCMIFVGSGHLFCISSSPFSFPSFSLPFFSLQYDGKKGPGLPPLSLSSFESLAGTRVKYRG